MPQLNAASGASTGGTDAAPPGLARQVVVMGVSGCGKSTVGVLLADGLGARYVEGDEHHPPANVERMRAGIPLTDADRAPWLQVLAGLLHEAVAAGQSLVLSCSALKRRYRDQLRSGAPRLHFVHLHGTPELLQQRVAARHHAYMPPTLLQSQLEALEPPGADERARGFDITEAPEAIAARALQWLRAQPESRA